MAFIPPMIAAATAAASGVGAAGGTIGSLAGAGAGVAGTTAAAAAPSLGTILGTTSAASGLAGTVLAATTRPKMPAKPPTPQAPTLTSSIQPGNTSMAGVNPGTILGGTFSSPASASATTYGKTVLGS